MADYTRQTRDDAADARPADAGTGAPSRDEAGANVEENAAQRQSDATPDVVAEAHRAVVETSDREDGAGSTANGTPASDEDDGKQRRKLYENGAELVSRID